MGINSPFKSKKVVCQAWRLFSTCECPSDFRVVCTPMGKIRGKVMRSVRGGTYTAFRGIPYGAPPLGPLRFKAPKPCTPWSGILDVLEEKLPCPQYDMFTGCYNGCEDCLYHNVFVPGDRLPCGVTQRKAVMLWVCGTGYCTTAFYGPDHLMRQGIILVTLNYRMGPFGFLSLQNSEVPGNAGVKDIVTVLKWIQENIDIFGGDPENVTVFGDGLGAVCTHILALSPLTKGLIHKAICQSGCALAPWGFKSSEEAINQTYNLAYDLGCKSNSPQDALSVLQAAPPNVLVEKQYCDVLFRCDFQNSFRPTPFTPTVEPPGAFEPVALSLHPQYVMENKIHRPMPIILGTNTLDGAFSLAGVKGNPAIRPVIQGHTDCLRFVLHLLNNSSFPPEIYQSIDKKIRDFYFWKRSQFTKGLVDIATDINMNYPLIQSLRLMAQRRDVRLYQYHFQFNGEWNFFKRYSKVCIDDIQGPSHLDAIPYLFYPHACRRPVREVTVEALTCNRMCQMWSRFAKCGNPTPPGDCSGEGWQPYKQNEENYLSIDVMLCLRKGFEHDRMEFWDRLTNYICLSKTQYRYNN